MTQPSQTPKEQQGPGRRWPQGVPNATNWANLALSRGNQSVHDWVYASLRHMILYNKIAPGDWLRQQEVSAQFKVSRTPVREAFRTLSQEGLVVIVPNHGARVSELSTEEFEEIYALRMGIEGLAARLTAQQIQPEQVRSLQKQLEALEKLTHSKDLQNYLQQEWQLRMQCYKVTQRQRLLKQVLFLREHSERYIYLAYGAKTRVVESFDFHRRLLEAFSNKEAADAESILQEALRWTLKNAEPIVAARVAEIETARK